MNEDTHQIRETANFWRSKVDEGVLSEAERQEFERWIASNPVHAQAYAEAELLWKALGEIEYDPSLHPERKGIEIPFAVAENSPSWSSHRKISAIGAGVAAMAASIVVALFLVLPVEAPTPIVYETAVGEIQTIALADGSEITLGAKSRLDVTITDQRRLTKLWAGAAYFDVASDQSRPFVVQAGSAKVLVTGTAFDLQRKGQKLHVAVEEGSVSVSQSFVNGAKPGTEVEARQSEIISERVSTVRLSAGQAVIASQNDGLGRPSEISLSDVGAWRTGQLVFFRASLAEIIDDVNRYADMPIHVSDDVSDLRMTATFDSGDIPGLLGMLETALPIKIEAQGGARWISAEK